MKSLNSIILFGLMLLVSSCGGENQQDTMMSLEVGKTYWEIRNVVFEDASGEDVEWHGEAMDKSALKVISISQNGDCGQAECGKSVILLNASNAPLEVVLQIMHGIGDIHPYFARKIIVEPNSSVKVGCSSFCVEEKDIELTYNIVGAKVVSK